MSLWVGRLIVNVYNFQINTLNSVNIQVKNVVLGTILKMGGQMCKNGEGASNRCTKNKSEPHDDKQPEKEATGQECDKRSTGNLKPIQSVFNISFVLIISFREKIKD